MRIPTSILYVPVLAVLAFSTLAPALDDGLCRTPPMGWNPWSLWGGSISETVFRQMADSMKSKGFLAAGYTYVNIDGGGSFPSGEEALGDYLHGKGFKFGVYGNDINYKIPGDEKAWADKWASWGADYVKYDCYMTVTSDPTWVTMRDALIATGRPMAYTCHASNGLPVVADTIAHMFRTGADILTKKEKPVFAKVLTNYENNNTQAYRAKPGYFNDPDFVLVGIPGGLTAAEERAQFGLWAIAAAPLILSCDVRSVSQASKDILLNPEVIAVDQDPLGHQGRRVKLLTESRFVYSKNLADGGRAVGLYNNGTSSNTITVRWADVGLSGTVKVRDVWAKKDLGDVVDSITVTVASHDCAMLRLTGKVSRVEFGLGLECRATVSRALRAVGTGRGGPSERVAQDLGHEAFDVRGCLLANQGLSVPGCRVRLDP